MHSTPSPSALNVCTTAPRERNPWVRVPRPSPRQHPVVLYPRSLQPSWLKGSAHVSSNELSPAMSTSCQLSLDSRRCCASAGVPPCPAATVTSIWPCGLNSRRADAKNLCMSSRFRWMAPFFPQWGNMNAMQSNRDPASGDSCKTVPSMPCIIRVEDLILPDISVRESAAPQRCSASSRECKLVAVRSISVYTAPRALAKLKSPSPINNTFAFGRRKLSGKASTSGEATSECSRELNTLRLRVV
mmetsp:Transcript_15331/g.29466  ORF Transcript_15331/g.29466 Transcript_15331/m.29466 type:complete len:244 (+) Transcript_15331:683-1414(+)